MNPTDALSKPLAGVCWILLGMMGAGKSTVGKFLAERSGRPFLDVDALLQRRFGRPIHQVFALYGEDAFRGHETSVLRGLEPSACVLATGGGIVLREENWAEMGRLGITLYLDAGVETLEGRLRESKKRRPLLEVDNWEGRLVDLLEARKPYYERADLRLDVSGCLLEEAAERAHFLFEEAESARERALHP